MKKLIIGIIMSAVISILYSGIEVQNFIKVKNENIRISIVHDFNHPFQVEPIGHKFSVKDVIQFLTYFFKNRSIKDGNPDVLIEYRTKIEMEGEEKFFHEIKKLSGEFNFRIILYPRPSSDISSSDYELMILWKKYNNMTRKSEPKDKQ